MLGPRPGNMSQNAPKLLHLWRHSQKIRNLQPKNFFSSAHKKTDRSIWAFEQLSSAIGSEAMALVRQPKTAGFRLKSRYEYIGRWLSKCQKTLLVYIHFLILFFLIKKFF